MDAQLKRGVLEACVLSALRTNDSYGYQIIKELEPYVILSESTLYPILKRTEANGYVQTYSREHQGRLRRYYRITASGIERIEEFRKEWAEMIRIIDFIEDHSQGDQQ